MGTSLHLGRLFFAGWPRSAHKHTSTQAHTHTHTHTVAGHCQAEPVPSASGQPELPPVQQCSEASSEARHGVKDQDQDQDFVCPWWETPLYTLVISGQHAQQATPAHARTHPHAQQPISPHVGSSAAFPPALPTKRFVATPGRGCRGIVETKQVPTTASSPRRPCRVHAVSQVQVKAR